MTAEVVVMNTEAVALAADSAGTISEQKVFTSVSKIFCLSRSQPVAIMLYGSAGHIEIPWEIIISDFRENHLKKKEYNQLEEYGKNFITFLEKTTSIFPEDVIEQHLKNNIKVFFYYFLYEFQNKISSQFKEGHILNEDKLKSLLLDEIDKRVKEIIKYKYKIGINKSFEKMIEKKYRQIVLEVIRIVFIKFNLSSEYEIKLFIIIIGFLLRDWKGLYSEADSGIVISGYGKKDYFPSIFNVKISGILLKKLLYSGQKISRISFENSAIIAPFAQAFNEIHTFIEGINPLLLLNHEDIISRLIEYIYSLLDSGIKDKKKIDKKIIQNSLKVIFNELKDYRKRKFVKPLLNVVSVLPKSELASFAESLVNLTSIKMHYTTSSQETVGGPIDVALISRNDGFIWIKRKHYFKPELNPQFFVRYLK